jgi:hypothetical protein
MSSTIPPSATPVNALPGTFFIVADDNHSISRKAMTSTSGGTYSDTRVFYGPLAGPYLPNVNPVLTEDSNTIKCGDPMYWGTQGSNSGNNSKFCFQQALSDNDGYAVCQLAAFDQNYMNSSQYPCNVAGPNAANPSGDTAYWGNPLFRVRNSINNNPIEVNTYQNYGTYCPNPTQCPVDSNGNGHVSGNWIKQIPYGDTAPYFYKSTMKKVYRILPTGPNGSTMMQLAQNTEILPAWIGKTDVYYGPEHGPWFREIATGGSTVCGSAYFQDPNPISTERRMCWGAPPTTDAKNCTYFGAQAYIQNGYCAGCPTGTFPSADKLKCDQCTGTTGCTGGPCSNGTCVDCSKNVNTPYYYVKGNICVSCLDPSHCTTPDGIQHQTCNQSTFTCQPMDGQSQCPNCTTANPVCNTATGWCGPCKSNSECSAGKVCVGGICTTCMMDSQCNDVTKTCSGGQCIDKPITTIGTGTSTGTGTGTGTGLGTGTGTGIGTGQSSIPLNSCASNTECYNKDQKKPICNQGTKTCQTCPATAPYYSNGACVACTVAGNCGTNQVCDVTSHACVTCSGLKGTADPTTNTCVMTPSYKYIFIIGGILVFLIIIAIVWSKFFRKKNTTSSVLPMMSQPSLDN